jgi:hypothetical protein
MSPLIHDGLVRELRAHVKGIRQRRKVYELTERGRVKAGRLRDRVKAELVQVKTKEGVRSATVGEVLAESGGRTRVLEIVRVVAEDGIYDPVRGSPRHGTSYVEVLEDAPQTRHFIGRQSEVERLTRREGGPRMVVIRGVAGIGKSSLAAEACERLRGRRNLFWHRVRPWDTFASLLTSLARFLSLLGRPALRSALVRGDTHKFVDTLGRDLPGSNAFLVLDDVHEALGEAELFLRLLKEVLSDVPDVWVLSLSRTAVPFFDRRDVALTGIVYEMDLGGLTDEEVDRYMEAKAAPEVLRDVSRRLGGHPLLLELMLARQKVPSRVFEEVNRFIEEDIYLRLTEPERRMMKLASMYQVPVPRSSFLVERALVEEVLTSLTDQSLLLRFGPGSWGIHDAVREFLRDFVSDIERQDLTKLAVKNLRSLARRSQAEGDYASCVAYLSNATQLTILPDERLVFLEALGDAHLEIGGLEESLAALRGAMSLTSEPDVLARLHGKMAFALYQRDVLKPMEEIDKGLLVLGEGQNEERGWLNLLKSRILALEGQFDEARTLGEIALETFRGAGGTTGEAKTLAWLAFVNTHARNGRRSNVHRYLQEAMSALGPVENLQLMADAYLWLASALAWGFGEADKAMHLLKMLDALPQDVGNYRTPTTRSEILALKGRVEFSLMADDVAAVASLDEAVRLGHRIRDTLSAADVKGSLAVVKMVRDDLGEARQLLEESIGELRARGAARGAVRSAFWAAVCSLLQDDVGGFLQAADAFVEAPLVRGAEAEPFRGAILQAFRDVVEGNPDACIGVVEVLVKKATAYYPHAAGGSDSEETWIDGPIFGDLLTYIPDFFGGVALTAIGHERRGREMVDGAKEVLRSSGYLGTLRLVDHFEGKLTTALSRAAGTAPYPASSQRVAR